MSETEPQRNRIQVAVQDKTGYAVVEGRGSFQVSASVKEFGALILERGVKDLVLDLGGCVGMDSTFMGVLAGLCARFHREAGGTVRVVNASEKIHRLMSTLGLDRLLDGTGSVAPGGISGGVAGLEDLEIEPQTPLESAETMLEAHENLVEAHGDNQLRFQDVLEYLREDIRRQRQG